MFARICAAFLTAGLALAGCNRVAGTEVGNPEIAVAARFALVDTFPGADVPEMNLKVMGMAYGMAGDTGACWNEPGGHMVDFASPGPASDLPMEKAKDMEWTDAELTLQAPAAAAILPDTAAFMDWENPRYAKLKLIDGADTLHALFDMPQGMKLKLMYGKGRVSDWRQGDTMRVDVRFDVGRWMAGLAHEGWTLRKDGKGVPYALFAEGENPAAWSLLKAGLPGAFMADSTAMR